jgi:hypothetical protein
MGELSRNLVEAVRKLAFRTSLDQLKQKGVKQVNVVGLDRLANLIEEAVKRSLQNRLAGLDRDAVADATKEEFMRLLRKNESLEKQKDEVERLRSQAEHELLRLRSEIDMGRATLEGRMQSIAASELERYAGENKSIAIEIDRLFQIHAPQNAGDLTRLRESLVSATITLLDKERKEVLAAREAVRDREVEQLERRLDKLKLALEENEKLMVQAAAMAPGDPGIASIYQSVQGLSSNESNLARKKELMAGIFEANLSLQKKPVTSTD